MFPFFPRKDKYTTKLIVLRARRWRLAGGERLSRVSQKSFNRPYNWVRSTKHAPRGPFRVLERLHAFADIVERRSVRSVERFRVKRPYPDRLVFVVSVNASRHGNNFT